MPGSVQDRLERRRYHIEQTKEVAVKYSIVEGVVPLQGQGETITTVNFPVQFTERPVFTFGHELDDNSWPQNGSFPTASATVVSWQMVKRDDTRQYWSGADVALVVSGLSSMKSLLHFQFCGRAFRNPVVDATGTVETL